MKFLFGRINMSPLTDHALNMLANSGCVESSRHRATSTFILNHVSGSLASTTDSQFEHWGFFCAFSLETSPSLWLSAGLLLFCFFCPKNITDAHIFPPWLSKEVP